MTKNDGGRDATLSTGVPGLDDVLGGPLAANHIYVVEGEPGSGKTTLGLQFVLEGAHRGDRVLYITFAESAHELANVAASHGLTLDGVDVFEFLSPEDPLDEGYTILHPSEVELGQTMDAVLREVDRVRPSRVVFDSLSDMRLLARDPLLYRRQIAVLKRLFGKKMCTVLLLDDGRGNDVNLQLRTLAHGVLLLDQVTPDFGTSRRRLRVSKLRAAEFRGGYHDYSIVHGGLVVYPRLVAAEHRAAFAPESVSSGVPALDTLLGGGFQRGTSALISGPAGAGKSMISTQYAIAAARRGERAAVYLFEETVGTFRMRAASLGWPFVEDGETMLTARQIDPAELSPGEFVHDVRRRVEQDGAKIIVIDSLNGFLNAMPDERFLLVHMHELLAYLDDRGVLTLLVIAQQGGFGAEIEQPVDVSYLADSILLLRYFEAEGAVRQAISVVKKRTGSHERTIRELSFTPAVTVGEPLRHFRGVLTGLPVLNKPKEERDDAAR